MSILPLQIDDFGLQWLLESAIISRVLQRLQIKLRNMHLEFGFSEKATKFEKVFVVLLTRVSRSVRATGYLQMWTSRIKQTLTRN